MMKNWRPQADLNRCYCREIAKIKHIESVHDVHVWTLSSSTLILSADVQVNDLKNWPEVLRSLKLTLSDQFHIEHITIQPEIEEELIQFI